MKKLALCLASILIFANTACASGESEPLDSDEDPIYIKMPASCTEEIEQAGKLITESYTTQKEDGRKIQKNVTVYLPYQYDPSLEYNILYLMHGGGGNINTLLGSPGKVTTMKYVLDHMIHNRMIEPLIVVAPTFYTGEDSDRGERSNMDDFVHSFQKELRDDLIPAVESTYSTYAQGTSNEALTESRNHRAFSGFSMGGVTTWYALAENLAYFETYIPASGDCWAIEPMGGRSKPGETAEYLANAIKSQGFSPLDFFIFAITGTKDMAYDNLSPQISAMKALSNDFPYSSDSEKGNLFFLEVEDGLHDYDWYTEYLYNILPMIF